MDAALVTFSEGGYEAASMNAIAERAGISKAVLYDCFPGGKEEMFDALLARTEADFTDYLAERWVGLSGSGFDETLRLGLEAFLGYAEHNPPAFRVIFGDAGAGDPQITARSKAVRLAIIERFTDGAMTNLGLGVEVRPVVELYTRMLIASAEELARWSAEEPPLSRSDMVSLAMIFLMQGFSGIMVPPSASGS